MTSTTATEGTFCYLAGCGRTQGARDGTYVVRCKQLLLYWIGLDWISAENTAKTAIHTTPQDVSGGPLGQRPDLGPGYPVRMMCAGPTRRL
ncbi:hypothetical protein VPH35_041419 [Triticum aestivum]